MKKDRLWAGGEHAFQLKIEHLRALQDKCGCGPQYLAARLASDNWGADDVVNVIRYGLEGGGMIADDARRLVRIHLEEKIENLKPTTFVAAEILIDALFVGGDSSGEVTGAAV